MRKEEESKKTPLPITYDENRKGYVVGPYFISKIQNEGNGNYNIGERMAVLVSQGESIWDAYSIALGEHSLINSPD